MAFEIETALIGLSGVLVGGAISSITTLLIQRTERQRYSRERSWDLRREAYTEIIGSLDRARAIAEHIDEGYRDDAQGWDASEGNKKAQSQMIEHFHEARMAFHAKRLMLSGPFIGQYEKMNRELGEASNPNLIPPESSEICSSVMKRIVPELEKLAQHELGIQP
ncbi:hypothetical protein [Sphingobium chlorophenolicum]|uniref:hypothetical protein n=1 Tax=Sphingobium chlorophenolicum TaxID=46429 RepID=UPI00059EB267|nr:hypothetical protein [Sphingobium chlorophenolicum]